MSIDERMTICNMSIEGGARAGYVNPDDTTFAYLRGPPVRARRATRSTGPSPGGEAIASDRERDRTTIASRFDAAAIEPTVTWGINPGQSVGISESIPADADAEALAFMGFTARHADPRHEDRRRVHRLLHQRPAVGPRGSRAHRARPPRGAAREGAGRAGLAAPSRAKPKRAACTRCSSTPASNGAAPAARCAWR